METFFIHFIKRALNFKFTSLDLIIRETSTRHNRVLKLSRERKRKCRICQTWNWSRKKYKKRCLCYYETPTSPDIAYNKKYLATVRPTLRSSLRVAENAYPSTYLPFCILHTLGLATLVPPSRIRCGSIAGRARTTHMCCRVAWIIRRLMRELLRLSGAYRCPLRRQRWTNSSFLLLSRLRVPLLPTRRIAEI